MTRDDDGLIEGERQMLHCRIECAFCGVLGCVTTQISKHPGIVRSSSLLMLI